MLPDIDMKITCTQFIKSAADHRDLPADKLPHIAFAGRSNVGKSSLLNSLLNRKKLALTSSTPGKTRLLNFFLINNSFYFVDLPGYGYAKVSKTMQKDWQILLENYLKSTDQLKAIIVLTDLRHDISRLDMELIEWLQFYNLKIILVGTKADKLSKSAMIVAMRKLEKQVEKFGVDNIIAYSAKNGTGKPELWQHIAQVLHD